MKNLNLQDLTLDDQLNLNGGNGIHSGGYGVAGTRPSAQTYSQMFHAAGDFFKGIWAGL